MNCICSLILPTTATLSWVPFVLLSLQHVFWLTEAFWAPFPCVCLRWCTLHVIWCADEPKQIAFSSGGFQSNFQRAWFHTCLCRFWQTDEWRTRRCCKSHAFTSTTHILKVFSVPSFAFNRSLRPQDVWNVIISTNLSKLFFLRKLIVVVPETLKSALDKSAKQISFILVQQVTAK